MRLLLFVILTLSPAIAVAQDKTPPCVRGPSTVVMAGVDITELKCEVVMLRMGQADAVAQLAKLQAQLEIARNDLIANNKSSEDMKAKMEALREKCGNICKQ